MEGGLEAADEAMEEEGWEMISKMLVRAPPTANDCEERRVGRGWDLAVAEEDSF